MPKNLQHLLNLVHKPNPGFDPERVQAFIDTWRDSGGAESSNSQPFFTQLFELLGLNFDLNTKPGTLRHVALEAPVWVPGESHPKKIDVYRPGYWLIEAKQGSFKHHTTQGHGERGSKRYRDEMEDAYHQAYRYAAHVGEGRPPVLMVVDVGYRFDVWTAFGQNYGGYGARGSFMLDELANPEVYALLYDLLARLVALNHERAEEEARGQVRWLRPEFQNPQGAPAQPVQPGLEGIEEPGAADEGAAVVLHTLAWPKDPLARIEALRQVVKGTAGLTTTEIQQHFPRGGQKPARERAIDELLAFMQKTGIVAQGEGGRWF